MRQWDSAHNALKTVRQWEQCQWQWQYEDSEISETVRRRESGSCDKDNENMMQWEQWDSATLRQCRRQWDQLPHWACERYWQQWDNETYMLWDSRKPLRQLGRTSSANNWTLSSPMISSAIQMRTWGHWEQWNTGTMRLCRNIETIRKWEQWGNKTMRHWEYGISVNVHEKRKVNENKKYCDNELVQKTLRQWDQLHH